ncbi:ArnT family glycosyltransferase [Celerinatantimonas yamalensis]|uniref:Glycosyltransferase family 39 protein n=1 Tax=Celerinatantimonas yamalensis TaxID=559956 RepID=A0ABW9G609_9GAMM
MRHTIFIDSGNRASWKSFLLLAIAAVIFSGLFNHTIWTPDEPRVVAVIKNMYLSGNFIIPQFAGIPFVEKPPLFFIYVVSLMHLTGLNALMASRLGLGILCLASLIVFSRLAWLLKGKEFAWISVSILATFEGFLLNFHWARVDAIMIFTSVAAIWAFAEAYLRFQLRYLLLAGALTGMAFLSKGPVAIAICVGPAWIALFARYLYLRRHDTVRASSSWVNVLLFHIIGLAIMCLVIAAWVYPFYKQASPELWHSWFWDNQVGRLTGTAPKTLGHNNHGKPFYYVSGMIEYTLPWTAFFFVGLVSMVKRVVSRHPSSWSDGFFLCWFCLAVFILSYSVTKRTMYLAPLTPLFALMAADAILTVKGRWSLWYRRFWLGIMIVLLAIFAVTPLWAGFLPSGKIPKALMTWLSTWQMSALWCVLAIVLIIKIEVTKWPSWTKLALMTSLFFIAVFHHIFVGIDVAKNMKPDLNAFVSQIPQDKRARIAGVDFSETMSSIFYIYDDWAVPMVAKARVQQIIDGKDSQYDYLLVDIDNVKKNPMTYIGLSAKTPYQLLLVGHPRYDKKHGAVLWLTGIKPVSPSSQQLKQN